jgi:hypothetical protein
MRTISSAAPQFLVTDLSDALAFYEERLGFRRDFVYEGFYASMSRIRMATSCALRKRLTHDVACRRSGPWPSSPATTSP